MPIRRGLSAVIGPMGAVVLAVALLAYAWWVWALVRQGPLLQIACIDSERPAVAWPCAQVLRHLPLSAEPVRALTLVAGISAPLGLKNAALSHELAASFIRQGVDVNATDLQSLGFSALHGAVLARDLPMIARLRKLGARLDVRDDQGRSVLELAQLLAARHPGDPLRAAVLQALQAPAPAG